MFFYYFVVLMVFSYHNVVPDFVTSFDDVDNWQTSTDSMVEDLIQKYAEPHHYEFWEPYSHGTGDENREVVQIDQIEEKLVSGNYLQWKHAQVGLTHSILGLTSNSVDVYSSDLKLKFSTESKENLVAMTVFTRWNEEKTRPEIIIVAVTTKPSLSVYKVQIDEIQKISSDWPLHNQISSIESTYAGHSTKLILVPADLTNSIDIYNVAVNGDTAQIWHHQRLDTKHTSNVVVYDVGPDSVIAVAANKHISICKFDNTAGKYVEYETVIIVAPSTKLVSFTLNYHRFLVSLPSSGESLEFFTLNGTTYEPMSFGSIEAFDVGIIKVEGNRDEQILVTRQEDETLKLFPYSRVNKIQQFQHWIGCSTETCIFHGSLSNSVSFIANNQSVYLLPTEENSSSARALVILTSIQETLSPLYKQSRDIFQEFSHLAKAFSRWETETTAAKKILENALSLRQPNIVSEQWNIGSITGFQSTIQSKYSNENVTLKIGNTFNHFSFVTSKWTDSDFIITPTEVETKLHEQTLETDSAFDVVEDSIPLNSETVQIIQARQQVSGIFTCDSLELVSSQIASINNQFDLLLLLTNIVLKEDTIKINALDFYGYLSVKNLQTNVLNGVIVGDIARLSQANEFVCPLKFQLPFNINGHVWTKTVNSLNFKREIVDINNVNGVTLTDGLVAKKESQTSGPIDSIDIEKTPFSKIFLKSLPQKIFAHFFFTEVQSQNNAEVTTLNGEDFSSYVGHIVSQDFSGIISGHKTVHNEVKCDSISIGKTLNGVIFPDNFVFASQKRIILGGQKSFSRVTASRITVDGIVDGVSTTSLVSLAGFAVLRHAWTLLGPVKFHDDVAVTGLVDGVKMDTLKHHDTLDQHDPNADIVFLQHVNFKNLAVESMINDKNFEEIFGGILFLDKAVVRISGRTEFRTSVKIDTLNLEANKINGQDIHSFFTLNTAQNISGNKIFESSTEFSSLSALKKFDSVELHKLLQNAFSLSKSREVSSAFSFEHFMCGSSMNVRGTINSFVKSFSTNVAVASGRKEQIFQTPVQFALIQAHFARIENLRVGHAKMVGGVDLESWYERHLSLSGNVKIPHPFKINGNVEVKKGIHTSRINGIALSHLASGVLRSDVAEQTFLQEVNTTGWIDVKNGRLDFKKKLSGFDVTTILANGISTLREVEERIHSSFTFETIVSLERLDVEGLTCGVDLELLNADVVRKSESVLTISGTKSFISDLGVTHSLKANLVNSEDLFARVFTLGEIQSISGAFEFTQTHDIKHKVLVDGFINGISVQELSAIYSFDNNTRTHNLKYNVESEGSLESVSLRVKHLVQNKNLNEYLRGNVVRTTDSEVRIIGMKSFTNILEIRGNISTPDLNNIDCAELSSRIAMRSSAALGFPHLVKFGSRVKVPSIMIQRGDLVFVELVGYNFRELISEAIHLNSGEALGNINFDSIVVLQSIQDVKTLNGVVLDKVVTTHARQKMGHLLVNTLTLEGENVGIGGTVLDHDLKQAFENSFLRNSFREQFVRGRLQFEGEIVIKGNFQCLRHVRDKIITLNTNHVISTQIEFVHSTHVNTFETTNLINGVRIEEVVSEALTQNKAEEITGHWTFKNVTFQANVDGEGLLDGLNLTTVVQDKKFEVAQAEKLVQSERNKFIDDCIKYDYLSTVLARSPCKFNSIDIHQTIMLTKPVEKVATLKTPKCLYMLAYEVTASVMVFRWSDKSQIFEIFDSALRLGNVEKWRSCSINSFAVLVYTTQDSVRSHVPSGINLLTLNSDGQFTNPEAIQAGNFNAIELVQDDKQNDNVALFAVNDQDILFVFKWENTVQTFIQTLQAQLKGPVNEIALVNYLNGVALFYHCDVSVHFDYYAWNENELKSLNETKFLANRDSALGLIENNGHIIGLVEGIQSSTQPDCSLHVFELSQKFTLNQKIKATRPNSISTFKLCGINYVASFSKSVGVTLYEFHGLSNFEVFNKNLIKVPDSVDMTMFSQLIQEYDSVLPFIVVVTSNSIFIYHSNIIGHDLSSSIQLIQRKCS